MSDTTQVLFTLTRGDDFALRVMIRQKDTQVPIDITGWNFKATMKLSPFEEDEKAPVAVDYPSLSGENAEAGIFFLTLPNEQTKNLLPAKYFFDLQREYNGAVVTVLNGKVSVTADVTNRVN